MPRGYSINDPFAFTRLPSFRLGPLSSCVDPVRAHPYHPFSLLTKEPHQPFADNDVHGIQLASAFSRNSFIVGICGPMLFSPRSGGQRCL